MHRAVAGLFVLISVPASADSPTETDPTTDVRAAATAFLTALDAGADEIIEVAFAPTVKLSKLSFATDACVKEFGRKRSVKRGRARLARCAFPEARRPDANTSLTIAPAGKAWDVIVDDVTLQFRRRAGGYVIERITGPELILTRYAAVASPGSFSFGRGTGTGLGVGTGGGRATEGDFVSKGEIHTTGSRPATAGNPKAIAPVLVLGTATGELGALAAREIDLVIRSRTGLLRSCYQKELNRTPDLEGTLAVSFEITRDGAVRSARIEAGASTLVNDAVESCVKIALTRMKFPAKGEATVTVPFTFSH